MMLTEQLLTKPGSQVKIDGCRFVYKKMSDLERRAYGYLERHRQQLTNLSPKLNVPELLSFSNASGIAKLSNLGKFPNLSARQYFGEWDGYSIQYLRRMNDIFETIRSLPSDDVPNKNDYETIIDGIPSSLIYVLLDMPERLPQKYHRYYQNIANQALRTQKEIESLKQYPAHRDPNPNNYKYEVMKPNEIAVVDWETFGLARRGYDEARLSTYLTLNSKLQNEYIQTICRPILNDRVSALYFWRVAAIRSLREITSFEAGYYDSRLNIANQYSKPIIDSLSCFLDRAINETRSLIR